VGFSEAVMFAHLSQWDAQACHTVRDSVSGFDPREICDKKVNDSCEMLNIKILGVGYNEDSFRSL
jgi:hypothetical protein